jgi:transcriptional regulator NrdR family protein
MSRFRTTDGEKTKVTIPCPKCGHKSDGYGHVVDSRQAGKLAHRRRRACLQCGHRYTTYERIELTDKEHAIDFQI